MRILLEVFVPRSEGVPVEFRLWDSDGKKVLAVVQIGDSDRSALATALLSLPELLAQFASAGVREVGWKGFVPTGRLRPASAWLFYGEIREPDLVEARSRALQVAEASGIRLDPDPAEGKVGRLGEVDLAKLLSAGNESSGNKGSVNSSSVRSRLK